MKHFVQASINKSLAKTETVSRREDERDVRLMALTAKPPHGFGCSMCETATILADEFPDHPPLSRNAVIGRRQRIIAADAKAHGEA